MIKHIAIITGGDGAEREISLLSAANIAREMDRSKYRPYIIELNNGKFHLQATDRVIDLNDFSLSGPEGVTHFDLAYLMLHGHPAEDGHLQGYFRLIGLPYTGCDLFSSALTFGKQATKDVLGRYGIPMAESILLTSNQSWDEEEIVRLGFPLFIKPNKNGSSFGVSKVKRREDLAEAIHQAFTFDDEVIAEAFLKGTEYSNGVFQEKGHTIVLPITEVIPENEFFDYKAKYENQSQEITPAKLSSDLQKKCQQQTRMVYQALNCRGGVRVDTILVGETFYFLEVNTIPGMSDKSIIPQQLRAAGYNVRQFIEAVIEEALLKT